MAKVRLNAKGRHQLRGAAHGFVQQLQEHHKPQPCGQTAYKTRTCNKQTIGAFRLIGPCRLIDHLKPLTLLAHFDTLTGSRRIELADHVIILALQRPVAPIERVQTHGHSRGLINCGLNIGQLRFKNSSWVGAVETVPSVVVTCPRMAFSSTSIWALSCNTLGCVSE